MCTMTLDLERVLEPLPPLPLRELVDSLKDDAVEVLRCPCGHSRLARLYHPVSAWELSDHDAFSKLHAQCGRQTDPGGRGE